GLGQLRPRRRLLAPVAWRSQVAHSLGVRVVGRSNRLAPPLLRVAARGGFPPRARLAAPAPWWHPARTCMGSSPLILVCNDDGVHSEGLAALAAAVQPLGDVVVVAP